MTDPSPTEPLSYSAIWDDAARMLRANAGLLTAIAGVFLFLPTLLVARYVPPPDAWATLTEYFAAMQNYFERAWLWLLIGNLANMIGAIAIYLLLLAEPRVTVGGAVKRALPILPFYYLLTLLWNAAVALGLLALIVPGLYLLGRLSLAYPALVVETPSAPISALRRSWQLTAGRGWSVTGFIIVVALIVGLIGIAVTASLGAVALLLLERDGLGGLMVTLLSALVQSGYEIVQVVLFAALYRALAPSVALTKRFA